MIKKIFKLSILFLIVSCGNDKKVEPEIIQPKKEKIIKEFGFILNNYEVKKDTIDRGDSFGLILEKNELYYPKIFNIVNEVKKVFDIRRVNVGRPYTILYSKDSIRKPEYFIYQPSSIDYLVVSLGDSIYAEKKQKEVKLVEYEASGVIKSSLSAILMLNISGSTFTLLNVGQSSPEITESIRSLTFCFANSISISSSNSNLIIE